jgi:hypothetical protein
VKCRFLATGLVLCGLALSSAAGIGYLALVDESGVIIQAPNREFPDCAVGQKLDVVFRFHNPSRHTIQVVGLAQC